MADFNPDAYLHEKSGSTAVAEPEFNPDTYLAEKTTPAREEPSGPTVGTVPAGALPNVAALKAGRIESAGTDPSVMKAYETGFSPEVGKALFRPFFDMTGMTAVAKLADVLFPKNPVSAVSEGVLDAGGDFVASLSSPKNASLMLAGGALGKLGTVLLSAGFEAQALRQAPEQWKQFKTAFDAGDYETATRVGTGLVAGVTLPAAAVAIHGAAPPKVTLSERLGITKPTSPATALAEPPVVEPPPTVETKPGVVREPPNVPPEAPPAAPTDQIPATPETPTPRGEVTPQGQAESPKTRMDLILDEVEKSGEVTIAVEGPKPTRENVVKVQAAAEARGMTAAFDGQNYLIRKNPVEAPSVPSAPLEPIGITEAIAEIQRRNAPSEKATTPAEAVQGQGVGEVLGKGDGTASSDAVSENVAGKSPTSTKNEQVDLERQRRGLPPAMEQASREFGTVWDEAAKKIDTDPTYQDRLLGELRNNPRAVTDTENAVVLRKQIEVQNQFEKASDDLIIANASNDVARAADLDAQLSRLSDDLLTIYDINKSIGRESGRGLNARKMLANEDFSLARMITSKRAAKGGKELNPIESAKVREQSREISTLQSKIDQAELKTHFNELLAVSVEEAKQAKAAKRGITDFLDEQANKARERIKARGGRLTTGIDPIDLADHAIIGASYISRGLSKFTDWSGQMIKDFGDSVSPYLKDLYARAKELHSANSRVFTSDERRLVTNKKRTANRIEELQGRIEAGNFVKPERPPPVTDKELDALRFKLFQVKEDYTRGVFNDQLARRSAPAKGVSAVREVLNTSRALKTSLDLSAVLRQGGLVAFAHPIRAAKAFPAMFKALWSEQGQFKVMNEIESRSNAPIYQQSKLYISDPRTTSLSKMEEAYMSRFAEKIPLVGASQRAYVTFLNKLRADSFDAMHENLARNGKATAEESRAIANYINVATGRGTLDGLSKAAVGLNTIFFAPRYVASRFEYLVGQPLYKGTARTRTLIAKEYARTLVGLGVVYTLAQMAGGDVETDSRSADFGKIRLGDTRIDPLAGLSQTTVLVSRVASGSSKKSSGEVVPIRGESVPFGSQNTADVLASFLRSKLAPIPGEAVTVAAGKNVIGQPVTPTSALTDLTVPLALSDIYSAMQDQGVDKGTALGLLSIFGMGLQTYAPTEKKPKKTKGAGIRQE